MPQIDGEKVFNNLIKLKAITAQKENIKDYFVIQQTKNLFKPLEYEEIITLFKDEKYSIKKISRKYCKKQLRISRLKRIILPLYLKVKDKLNG